MYSRIGDSAVANSLPRYITNSSIERRDGLDSRWRSVRYAYDDVARRISIPRQLPFVGSLDINERRLHLLRLRNLHNVGIVHFASDASLIDPCLPGPLPGSEVVDTGSE